MKKITLSLFTVLFIVLVVGCQKPSSSNPPTTDLPETEETLIETPASDFEYSLISSGIKIVKYIGNDDRVVIPQKIDDTAVSVIGASSFMETNIKSVIMPDSVISISDSAFTGCKQLTDVRFSNSLRLISTSAFMNCISLKKVDLSANTLEEIFEYAFYNCENLTEVIFGDNINIIEERAFSNCVSLQNVNLPKNLNTIGDYSFADCIELKSVTIPKTLTFWGMTPFSGNLSLDTITFEEGLKQIGWIWGAFAGCPAEKLTIPASVNVIASIAFSPFRNLREVIFLGDAPAELGEWPFGEPRDSLCIYYDPSTSGWDITPLKNDYQLLPLEK